MIFNILQHASKFSSPHGSIEITTQADDGEVVPTGSDFGMGFEPADSGRIFELSVRLDDDKNHGGGGLGIGLAIVKPMVEMHGGSVRASSEGPGNGATFEVRFAVLMRSGHCLRSNPPTSRGHSGDFSSPTTTWMRPSLWNY